MFTAGRRIAERGAVYGGAEAGCAVGGIAVAGVVGTIDGTLY